MIKEHPYLKGILVDSEGLIYIPKSCNQPAHWTKGSVSPGGYLYIGFKNKGYRVHRLVAETFIPNPENKPVVDHIDRNITNNNVSNLRWATQAENMNNTKRNRPEGKRLRDFASVNEYTKDRLKEKYRTDPEYRKRKNEYRRKWREKKRQSM